MSYAIYVGKNHTRDGIAYIAGYGDEPSSHYLEIIPRQHHDKDATIEVGVTDQADMPGIRTRIPQVAETARHIRTSYSYYLGVPAPITNGGLNEHGVAVRDIWSTSRQELIDITPKNQSGPNYSDLARIVLERAKTARQGVEIISELIDQYGESTYGGNSHFIADADEAWVVIEFAGNKGLWAAERLGADSIRASRPGYIEDIDFHSENFLTSKNMESYAIEQGWYDPNKDTGFNVNKIYGDGKSRWQGVRWIEEEMNNRAQRVEKISIADMMWAIRTEKLTGDTAGYGQVVPLHNPSDNRLRFIWHTQIGAIAAHFVPVFMGCTKVPEEFGNHRYLTVGESSRFSNDRHATEEDRSTVSSVPQGIESIESATAVFKRLMYLVFQHQEKFLAEVTEVWLAKEKQLIIEVGDVLKSAEILIRNNEIDLAEKQLTYFSHSELIQCFNLAKTLAGSIDARTKILYEIDNDLNPKSPSQIW
jgi:dipeptidase